MRKKKDSTVDYLGWISQGSFLNMNELDGTVTIAQSKHVFESSIDSDLEGPDFDSPGKATSGTAFKVYELIKDGKFPDIFSSVSPNLDDLVVTQHQIVRFCERYRKWLCRDFATFFLVKEGGKYSVIGVGVRINGLRVNLHKFRDKDDRKARCRYRFIIPCDYLAA
ncbi:MAG: hypothetical protein WCJ57_01000 [Candidatus Falkowbacteria bacterium]